MRLIFWRVWHLDIREVVLLNDIQGFDPYSFFTFWHPFFTIYKRWSIISQYKKAHAMGIDCLPLLGGRIFFLFFLLRIFLLNKSFAPPHPFPQTYYCGCHLFGYWTLNNWWFNNYLYLPPHHRFIACPSSQS